MKMICCVCHKTKSQKGWDWVKQSISQTRNLSHGYCPDCYRKTIRRIESNNFQEKFKSSAQAINLK